MRRLSILIITLASLFFAAPVYAQGPTPLPPSTPTPTLPETILEAVGGKPLALAWQQWGLLGASILLAVLLIVFIVFLPVGNRLQAAFDGLLGKIPFSRRAGLRRYLKVFIDENKIFGFRGMETFALNPIDLTTAYIQLDLDFAKMATKEPPEKDAEHAQKEFMRAEERPVFRLAQIMQAGYKKLAIVGDAGSGKSALLQWAGLALAQAYLNKKLSAEQKEFLEAVQFHGWFRPLFPVMVPLRKYHAYCAGKEIDKNSLYEFIGNYTKNEYRKEGLPDDLFHYILKAGCLLMFDGVDEVDFDDRPAVRAAIEGLICDDRNAARNIYIVTMRPSAAETAKQLEQFETAQVCLLTPEKRQSLIALWCKAVYRTSTEAEDKAVDLTRRTQNYLVNEMAVTPLMVNIFALVYFHSRDLPSQRAELFEQAVKALLIDPQRQSRTETDDNYWGGRQWQTRLDDMALIAYILHDENKSEIFADDLLSRELFWTRFGAEKESAQQAASDFLDLVARRGGLLRQDGKRYDFYIRRFREFLAGHYLARKLQDQWRQVILKHIHNDQWVEPLQLAIGFLVYSDLDKAKKLMEELVDVGSIEECCDHALAIAGITLADALKNKSAQGAFEPQRKSLPAQLARVLEKNPPVLALDLRQRLGVALGEIGDPRFPVITIGETRVILPELVAIPAGVFRMGTSPEDEKILKEQKTSFWDDEKPAHQVYVSGFEIGMYPVTNAEFRLFWEQKGYANREFWSADGWKWRSGQWDADLSFIADEDVCESYQEWLARRPAELRGQPFFWDDPQWNAPNLPVVGVCWFEAEAYCKWLSYVSGQSYRLPSEAEWEKAARGPQALLWPWGDAWDAGNCNNDEPEDKLGGTSPVGLYPHGASAYGALDVAGNVWEWCLDWDNEAEYRRAAPGVKDPAGPETGNARVLRGGAWNFDRNLARCACHRRQSPDFFFKYIGFRLACTPSAPIPARPAD